MEEKRKVLFEEGDYFTHTSSNLVLGAAGVAPTLNPGGPVQASSTIYQAGCTMYPGHWGLVEKFVVSTTGPCYVSLSVRRSSAFQNALEKVWGGQGVVFGAEGGVFEINNIELQEFGSINATFTALTNLDTRPICTIAWNGVAINEDYNYKAKKSVLCITDSIGYTALGNSGGGSDPNRGITTYNRRLVSALRSEGKDVRLCLKGVSGSTASQHALWVVNGNYDGVILNSDLIEIALGTNDAAAGTAAGTNYSSNIQIILDRIRSIKQMQEQYYSVVLSSPPGSDKAPISTNLPGYQTALQDIIALPKYAGMNIVYFDRTIPIPSPSGVSSLFTETANGQRLHPRGDTGHAAIFNSLLPIVKQTRFYNFFAFDSE